MPQDVYEIISLAMRYWFTALGVLIVWRAFSWLRKDRRQKHKRLRQLPDAGMIGELVVLEGSRELPEDTIISVPREGTLGFLRTCDVVIPVGGVAAQHADFAFVNGQGLRVFPRRGCACSVDGHDVSRRSEAKRHAMGHSSILVVGDAVLRLRLFAGLDAPYRPYYEYEEEQSQAEEQLPPPEWQQNVLPPSGPYSYAPPADPRVTQPFRPISSYEPENYAPQPSQPCYPAWQTPLQERQGSENPYMNPNANRHRRYNGDE